MRHAGLIVALYIAIVAELADVRLPGGLHPWWLDLVLLLAIRSLAGLPGMMWCIILGLTSDVLGHSPPGLGLLLGATLGLRVSQTTDGPPGSVSRVSLLLVSLGLLLWHVLTARFDPSQGVASLPLLRSGFTVLSAVVLHGATLYSERSRQSQLLQASR